MHKTKKHYEINENLNWNQILWRANRRAKKNIYSMDESGIYYKHFNDCAKGSYTKIATLDCSKQSFIEREIYKYY